MSTSYYAFFVTDDKARWQAFLISNGIGTAAAAVLYVLGFTQRTCVIAGCVIGVSLFTVRALQYITAGIRRSRYSAARSRRALISTILVGTASWAIEAFLANLGAALAFADRARKNLNDGDTVSASQAAFYKAVIASHVSTVDPEKRHQLLSAHAVLTCAASYSQLRRYAQLILYAPGVPPPMLNQPFVFQGESPEKSVVLYRPKTPKHSLFEGARDFALVSLGFRLEQSFALTLPVLIRLEGRRNVTVLNCIVDGFDQALSGIMWFGVVFKNCDIEINSDDLTLVDATFQNCKISADETMKRLFPDIESGSISGVTFSPLSGRLTT